MNLRAFRVSNDWEQEQQPPNVVNVEGLLAVVDSGALQQGLPLYTKVEDLSTLFARETRVYTPTSSAFFARKPFFLS